MKDAEVHVPNPRRVAAGRINGAKTKPFTAERRAFQRQLALVHQPWRFATGPRSVEGKRRSAANGKLRQLGPKSRREVQREIAELRSLLDAMREGREMALGGGGD